MSDWKVQLECEEGGSHKFWRARCEGTKLFVNYGRIGTNGQTQVKEFGSEAESEKELASLERSKRKKGYVDSGSTGATAAEEEDGDEDEEPTGEEEQEEKPSPKAAKPAAAPAAPKKATSDLALDSAERKVQMRITQDGDQIRIVAVERHPSAEAAGQAFARLEAAMKEEGYQPAKLPEAL